MSNRKIIMGVDTSNYTTSIALIDDGGELIANLKRPLPVREGERGLRQSDAVFHHIRNIPELMIEVKKILNGELPVAIGVSEKPRNIEGSYMPCFLSGVAVAESISSVLNIPIYRFSHQCGHIMAALYSSHQEALAKDGFCAFHVSGGTTEIVKVSLGKHGFDTELVGGTKDLNAGQAIDRIGVLLGLKFPCGPQLEQMALNYKGKIERKNISVKGTYANLSGLENMAIKMYSDSNDKEKVSAFVLDYIGRTLCKLSSGYVEKYGQTPFVYAGGVMCNSIIKKMLSEKFEAYFAEPSMSADNAVGIAELTRKEFLTNKEEF